MTLRRQNHLEPCRRVKSEGMTGAFVMRASAQLTIIHKLACRRLWHSNRSSLCLKAWGEASSTSALARHSISQRRLKWQNSTRRPGDSEPYRHRRSNVIVAPDHKGQALILTAAANKGENVTSFLWRLCSTSLSAWFSCEMSKWWGNIDN